MSKEKKIFFHTGLSKTGSTFLQHQVFPLLQGIEYVPTVKFRCVDKYIRNSTSDKILVSREFDQQFEKEVQKFSTKYPDAYPIVVFREHGNWIVSQYKRFVKNGHPYSFQEFIDLQKDNGRFKKQDLNFQSKITILEKYFHQRPLVLLYEELKSDPEMFIQHVLDYTGASISWEEVNFKPKHKSYSEHSLKLVRKISAWLPFEKKLEIHRKPIGFVYNLYANILRYTILYSSKLLPKSFFEEEEFIQKQSINQIRNFCKSDWEFIQSYVQNNHGSTT